MTASYPQNIVNTLLRVLVVEDDLLFNALYKNFLQAKEAEVSSCTSLAGAEQLLSSGVDCFDAVILDNQLTDGLGLSLLPGLKKHSGSAAVIMVSGNDDAEFFLNAFNAGIHDYIVKPVNLDLLWLKITKAVKEQRLSELSQRQHQELEYWVEQEQQQQALAKHLFDRMFHDLNQPHPSIHAWLKPHSCFSGDAILRCQGEDGSWYFLLADAMGHGLAPAISLMPLMRAFQAMAEKSLPLSNIVFEVNKQLHALLPEDRFVAAVMVRLDPWRKSAEVWNGGLPAVQFIDAEGGIVASACSKHMALGILANSQLCVMAQVIPLQTVRYLVIHSDGLTETPLENGDTLSVELLLNLLEFSSANPLHPIQDLFTVQTVHDDISLCMIDLNGLFTEQSNQPQRLVSSAAINVVYLLSGAALACTDLPAKAVDFLKAQNIPLSYLQRVFTVLTELFVNALEHGVLQLDSALKAEPEGFIHYYTEKEQRLAALKDDAYIELSMTWCADAGTLTATMTDSGIGFDQPNLDDAPESAPYGRGLALISQLTDEFVQVAPGNSFRFCMTLPKDH